MKKQTVLSMEQALSLPSATLRFAQLGWRVIRLEPVIAGQSNPGDPNRYIGNKVADNDRHSYFIAPNVGKESIAINLKEREGQELLKKIIINLDVDIFCCNTIPSRYESLGIDYKILKKAGSLSNNVGRMGHGLGLQLTEPPSIMVNENALLEENMIITIEPCFEYQPNKMLVHEENILITKNGHERLTTRTPKTIPLIS